MAKNKKVFYKVDSSMGFLGWLTLLFVGLKLMGYLAWSWFWVLSPLWISLIVFLLLFFLVFFGDSIIDTLEKWLKL
jgi:fatty acid desaturase